MLDKKNYSQLIIEYLFDEIKSGTLKPGDKIATERELCELLGVSRPPIREALKALSTIGILVTRPGGGTYVNTYDANYLHGILKFATLFSPELLLDFIQVRMALESEAARLAAINVQERDLQELKSVIEQREAITLQNKDNYGAVRQELDALDYKFHIAVTKTSGNAVFTEFIKSIRKALSQHQQASADAEKSPERSNRFHRQIYEAIAARDSDRAFQLMYQHLATVRDAVMQEQKEAASE
ncbi:FadR family transcriptional regulator [Lachnospiraceae bacterium]|nr:FadR family transcriptional regulator [Lachnospiraceae bacterium]